MYFRTSALLILEFFFTTRTHSLLNFLFETKTSKSFWDFYLILATAAISHGAKVN